jgi:hypothetical protein
VERKFDRHLTRRAQPHRLGARGIFPLARDDARVECRDDAKPSRASLMLVRISRSVEEIARDGWNAECCERVVRALRRSNLRPRASNGIRKSVNGIALRS